MLGFKVLLNHRGYHRCSAKSTAGQDLKAGDAVAVEWRAPAVAQEVPAVVVPPPAPQRLLHVRVRDFEGALPVFARGLVAIELSPLSIAASNTGYINSTSICVDSFPNLFHIIWNSFSCDLKASAPQSVWTPEPTPHRWTQTAYLSIPLHIVGH